VFSLKFSVSREERFTAKARRSQRDSEEEEVRGQWSAVIGEEEEIEALNLKHEIRKEESEPRMNAKIEKEEYKEAASDLASSVYFRRKGGFFFDLRSTIHDLFYDLCALAVNHF
jgi:alpha-galactosidase/6-phospho-beta-glucosidase family protein